MDGIKEFIPAHCLNGNPHLAHAELMTSAQEQAFTDWLEEASRLKAKKADRRRKAEIQKRKAKASLPERLAAQTALIEANGGRLPPRWRYEMVTETKDGKTVEQIKRIANRPAHISAYPYDPAIDGPSLGKMWQKAAERQARIDEGFRLSEDIILSGCLVRSGLKFEGFKSEALGTKSALRWPALVHKSRSMRVCWHRGEHSDVEIKLAEGRMEGVPDWMLAEFENSLAQDKEAATGAAEGDVYTRVLEPAHFKILGMDAPIVEGNKTLLGFLRFDTDLVWRSIDHLMKALNKKVKAKKIRSLPNFIVGIRTADGRLIRPHLIWLLPINSGVLNVDNKFLRKFKAVYYGLCRALADLGADPEAPATSQLVKNPLSPLYHTECPSDEWPSLDEHAAYLDMSLDRAKLMRENIATVTGETFRHSNEFFNGCLDAARSLMVQWDKDHDPMYLEALASGDRDPLINRLQKELTSLVASQGMKPKSIKYARRKVATWVVNTWNPNKISGKSMRSPGRLQHLVSEIRGVKERQAFAGRYTAAVRADKTIERLIEAWNRCTADGKGIPSKTALAKTSGLSRQTVHNRFEELQSAIGVTSVKDALCYIGRVSTHIPKKPIQTIGQPSENGRSSETRPARPCMIDSLVIANDNETDNEALAEHEAWIAFQEHRDCRDSVMDTVIDIVSKSSEPTMRHWRRCGGSPTAIDVDDDYIVCPPDGLFFASDAVKAA
ncbi:hypothetical protein ACK6D9_00690 [Hoeflea sp. Naph1]|uniref:hypothetical protein n=1 Tax=Hoeflea sp. Naph1 TaxID=3388653 RepID=UPI00398FBDB9